MLKRPASYLALLAIVGIAVAGVLTAQTPARLSAFAGGPAAEPLTGDLPPVARGEMNTLLRGGQKIISYDDNTCESGIGAGGGTVTGFVDFDVPTSCTPGFNIVGVTARINTNSAQSFAFGQAGSAPPAVGAGTVIPLTSNIAGAGPCPATGGFATRPITGATITGSSNFFAGVVNTGFLGRDTNSDAGRMWFNCGGCGMTQYTPTDLAGIGLGGNLMIRVTVETCPIPVELMDFNVIDG